MNDSARAKQVFSPSSFNEESMPMKALRRLAVASALAVPFAVCAGPFDGFKGKMKEGMYEYKTEMDMGAIPGLPPGMGKQAHTFQQCVTAQDIDKGQMSRGREGKMPENCEVRDMKMSGDTATYTMECKGDVPMKADNRITFAGNGFDMDMKMAMSQGGQVMNMSQKIKARHIGACKK
jgi:hypothetical protein